MTATVAMHARGRLVGSGQGRRPYLCSSALALVMASLPTFGCGGEDASQQEAEYVTSITAPLRQLTGSAVATGKLLARVTSPNQLSAARSALNGQMDAVEAGRQTLAAIKPAADHEQAHRALVAAAGQQRSYLVLLGRAVSVKPKVGLQILTQARAAGGRTTTSYRAFFAVVPTAADAITGTDLKDTSGIASALREQEAVARRRATPVQRPARRSAPTPTPSASSSVRLTIAEARALTEEAARMTARGRWSEAEALSRRALTLLDGSGDSYEGNSFYNLGLSVLELGRCSEALTYLGRSLGTGNNRQNAVRQGAYSRAQSCAF